MPRQLSEARASASASFNFGCALSCTTLRVVGITTRIGCDFFESDESTHHTPEKDFWVCYILSILFRCEFGESLVFKDGTSLSKVFGAINRFSEDIDLSLLPEFLKLPEPGISRNQGLYFDLRLTAIFWYNLVLIDWG